MVEKRERERFAVSLSDLADTPRSERNRRAKKWNLVRHAWRGVAPPSSERQVYVESGGMNCCEAFSVGEKFGVFLFPPRPFAVLFIVATTAVFVAFICDFSPCLSTELSSSFFWRYSRGSRKEEGGGGDRIDEQGESPFLDALRRRPALSVNFKS